MLYALGDPVSFVALVLSFLVAATLHGWVQALVATRTGDRRPAAEGRTRLDPRRHVDPFGAVAAAIAGVGWARPVEPPDRRRRGALVAVLLSGAVANLVVGFALLVGVRVLTGGVTGMTVQLLQYGVGQGIGGGDLLARTLLMLGLMNVYVGALSLVPLPPLDGGRLLFALAPAARAGRRRSTSSTSATSASPSCSRCCSSRSAVRRRCCRPSSTRSSARSSSW